MTSVAHNHADVVLGCECQGGLDIGVARDVDGIVDVVAQNTRLRLGGEGIAALVGEEGLHHRVGCRVATYRILSDMRRRRGWTNELGLRQLPIGLQLRTNGLVVLGIMAWRSNGDGRNKSASD